MCESMGRDFIGKLNVGSKMIFSPGISMLEDCEGSMMWVGGGTGGDWSVGFTDSDCLFGEKSLRLVTRVTGASAGDLVYCIRYVPVPESLVLVFQGRMAAPVLAKVSAFRVFIDFYIGGKKYTGSVKVEMLTGNVQLRNSAGAYVTVSELGQGYLGNAWLDWKIVVDRETKRYLYVEINGVRSDQSGVLDDAADANGGRAVRAILYVHCALNEPGTVDFDSMYVGSLTEL